MANTELFALALGLTAPWYVKDISFDAEAHRLDTTKTQVNLQSLVAAPKNKPLNH